MFFKKKVITNNWAEDFPSLKTQKNLNAPPIYFDNACVSLKPQTVIDTITSYYQDHPSCARRSVHAFGKITSKKVTQAREYIRDFFGANSNREVVFTPNTTAGINLVARGLSFKRGDIIITSNIEHNSNTIPWMKLAEERGVILKKWTISPDGKYDIEELFDLLNSPNVKLLSLFSKSHVLGIRLPIENISKITRSKNIPFLVDAAQSILHEEISLKKWDVDFITTSFHKGLGPSATGCLIIREEMINKVTPYSTGGETVDNVTNDSFAYSDSPYCYEPGLQNYSGILGAHAACLYLKEIGYSKIFELEEKISRFIHSSLKEIDGVILLGSSEISEIHNFRIDGIDSGEVSLLLDQNYNIMVRSGVHCCHSWYNENKLEPSLRASLAFYNTQQEAEKFINAIKDICKNYR